MISPANYQEFARRFRDIFETDLLQFFDFATLVAFHELSLNLERFETWLNKKHPEDKALSIKAKVKKYYGERASQLIEEMI